MVARVGFPRAMGYYYLYPFFRTLVRELGAELVLSSPTSQRSLERMETCPTDEPCLAVKLHFSHADELAARDDLDFLLVPIIARVDKTYCCPKFIGVADMIRHGLRLPDTRIVTPVVDYSPNRQTLCAALKPLTDRLGISGRQAILRAVAVAQKAQDDFHTLCIDHQLTIPEAYRLIERDGTPPDPSAAAGPTIAVIGHPYITYETISHGMIATLRSYGRVVTAEMVEQAAIDRELATIEEGSRMWPFEAMLLGAALHLLRARKVDKMVLVGSFECGPESIIESYIDEEAQRQGIPLMVLTFDEHTGEAGLITRLEAFMDTERIPSSQMPALPTPHVIPHEEIILGVPSMGYLDIAVRNFLSSFGTHTLVTPRSKACVELGRELAPEFVCYPFVATLGQLRMLLDQGANTLLMVGGKGYCRLGWYAQVQERLLRSFGYEFQLLEVDSPFPLFEKWGKFAQALNKLTGGASWPRIIGAIHTYYHQLRALDNLDRVGNRIRAFERVQGTANTIVARYHRLIANADMLRTIRALEAEFLDEVSTIELEETDPVRIRISGEIWVIVEQSATREVEQWLSARMRPRVWIDRELSASSWFENNVLRKRAVMRREHQVEQAARPWLSQKVGGHGQHTVGLVALAPEEGIDGVLHIFPFTCMPEIIAQNIIVRVAEEMDIPVLSYIVSEQTGEAGMETRLESFLDLLEERRLGRLRTRIHRTRMGDHVGTIHRH